MKKAKSIVSLIICLSLFLTLFPVHVIATTPTHQENGPDSYIECSNGVFTITAENLDSYVAEYRIPLEVAIGLRSALENATEDTVVTLQIPSDEVQQADGLSSYATNGWSDPITYNGMVMKDYVITTQAKHEYKNILSSAGSFSEIIAVYLAGKLYDSILPFGAELSTLADLMVSCGNSPFVATPGDQAEFAPAYTRSQYYTYVITTAGEMLGTVSYRSNLDYILWTYYYQANHNNPMFGISYYDNATYQTPSFANRYYYAYLNYSTAPRVDDPVEIVIGGSSFYI